MSLSHRYAYGVKAHLLNMTIYTLGVFPLTYLIVNLRPNVSTERNVTTVNMVTTTLDKVQHHGRTTIQFIQLPVYIRKYFKIYLLEHSACHTCNIMCLYSVECQKAVPAKC